MGEGDTGTVLRAVWPDADGDLEVALRLLPNLSPPDLHVAMRAAQAAASLSHPNVVPLLDAGRVPAGGALEPGRAYLVTPWIDGSTIATTPPISWAETAKLTRDVLDALGHAHGRGVLHLDLKPTNVIRTGEEKTALLMDFGVAPVVDPGARDGSGASIVGTPRYMSPEQVLGERTDFGPWTDVYGLAALVWEVVTGRPLFEGEPDELLLAHARQRPPSLNARFAVPYGLRNWLYTSLEKRPRDRFQSVAEARAALDDMNDADRTSRYPVVTPGSEMANVATRLAVPQRHVIDDRPLPVELRFVGSALLGARCPVVVGRETEKELLWNAFRRVSRLDRAEVAIITGVSGAGKTTLVRWLARRAGEGGYAAVLDARHDGLAAGEDALEDSVARWLGLERLALPQKRTRAQENFEALGFEDPEQLAREFVGRGDVDNTQHGRLRDERAWHTFLLEFARKVGAGSPTLWLLDDVDRSDATARFVEAAGEAEFGLLTVATSHDASVVTVRRSFDLEMGPLRTAALRELVEAMLPLEPGLTTTIVDAAQGRAAYATALLSDWGARDVLEAGALGYRVAADELDRLPDGVAAMWQRRVKSAVASIGDAAAIVLRAAAVLGVRSDLAVVRQVSEQLGVSAVDPVIEALARVGLVEVHPGELRLAHEQLQEAIHAEAGDLSSVSLVAASAIERTGTSPRTREVAARQFWVAGKRVRALDHLYAAIVGYDTLRHEDAVAALVPLLTEWADASGKGENITLAGAIERWVQVLERRAATSGGATNAALREATSRLARIYRAAGDHETAETWAKRSADPDATLT